MQEVSAELCATCEDVNRELWKTSMECVISIMGRKKAERLLRLMTERFVRSEAMAEIADIRPRPARAAERVAQREAATVFVTVYLPLFIACLPPG